MPCNAQITAAAQYALANPEERYESVAARFNVNTHSLKCRMIRMGIKKVKLYGIGIHTVPKWRPVYEYADAHPEETIMEIAARFGVSAVICGQRLSAYFGRSHSERRAYVLNCRLCGEKDPDKFYRSSRRKTGYQDKCKACSHQAYLVGEGLHRKRLVKKEEANA